MSSSIEAIANSSSFLPALSMIHNFLTTVVAFVGDVKHADNVAFVDEMIVED
jgi:hypothetical protein